jgi:hypothetical protein
MTNELKPQKCTCGCDMVFIQYPEWQQPKNFVSGRKIKDFKVGDMLYIQESKTGFAYDFLCEFISYERGNVKVKIIGCPERHEWLHGGWIGKILSVKPCKCFLWGLRKPETRMSDHDFCCHWFENGVCV